ncbi:MAG: ABC transporter ATP-binding protein [Pelolinea sp.]|nr:ABC transporter ATP-binding protein [Pelolinea sp.]
MATITIDRISKSFGSVQALKGVSFDAKNGEFVVIVGPSGAGKSTTLNCIAGVEYPEMGTILIDDQDVTLMPPQDRDVAMVFENYALYPQMSVRENLAFPLRSPKYRVDEDEITKRIERVSGLLGIDVLLHRLPRQLSQGQRQRVSLGRALVRDPKVYLFDEPISHLDAKLRNAMRRELKLIRASLSQTTIYVTHDYLEALSLADRVVVLFKGEVLQFDQKEKIYNLPAAMEVGQLFGDPPMMFFEGKADENDSFVSNDRAFSLSNSGISGEVPVGTEVVLGLRPTEVNLVPEGKGQVKGKVYSVQNQFDHQLITIKAQNSLFDVVAAQDVSLSEGDKAWVNIPNEVCYFFNKETHKVIGSK